MQTQISPPTQRSNRRPIAPVCALLWFIAITAPQLPSPAHAQVSKDELAKAEAKALQAKFKFKAEAYAEAAELFLEAFTISKSPALLFNAARAFEEAKRYKEARAAFEQYLSLPGLSASGRDDARAHIASCDAKIAESAQPTPSAGVTPPGKTPPTNGPQPSPGSNTPATPPTVAPRPLRCRRLQPGPRLELQRLARRRLRRSHRPSC